MDTILYIPFVLDIEPHTRATIETLLSKDFTPARTVVLAFGFDEEASGIKVILLAS